MLKIDLKNVFVQFFCMVIIYYGKFSHQSEIGNKKNTFSAEVFFLMVEEDEDYADFE
jgi:hypothetical protein